MMLLNVAKAVEAREAGKTADAKTFIAQALKAIDEVRGAETAAEYDPWMGFNRKIFWFNDQLDTHVLVPVATGWQTVTPQPMQDGISNFFSNRCMSWVQAMKAPNTEQAFDRQPTTIALS